MARFSASRLVIFPALLCMLVLSRADVIRMPSMGSSFDGEEEAGTSWAILVAGSSGYGNYRHQADVCHAYQILRKGGLKEENIVVFMFDDLANNRLNPRPGIIINHPHGQDVYAGVPKTLLTIKSSPGMPNLPYLYAEDFISLLQNKYESNSYREMVIYIESCESGSMFEGMMSEDLKIYVTTASNAEENSWGTYCPGMIPPPPPEYSTCLGDLYSVSWMEDSESHNLKLETIEKQYQTVKARTLNFNTSNAGSHVMEYGTKSIKAEKLYLYQGFDPSNANISDNYLLQTIMPSEVINQRDADLLFMWKMYEKLDDNSNNKTEILEEITATMKHRLHLDSSVDFIGKLIFGSIKGPSILRNIRSSGQPLVDDWDCLKSMVRIFESHCGSLTQYGMKHMRAFANICNKEISMDAMEEACISACGGYNSAKWNPLSHGYSA
ncbi:hypothetical protein KFK09_008064 [Dendrobium nobile]|uniref:Legumain prodomain domain-containing protein n=1 Tax=Dendrobium nobile TaxID=94219 RepID=A0A8T3BTH6_DENNO|nr:hypothetical protein KFK09_008064 [Dendrobium nobile]